MSKLSPLEKPCPSCPWRTDKEASDIPNFELELAEKLARCCPDADGFGPSYDAAMFACHCSKEGAEWACAGWLARVGEASPLVRMAIAVGAIDPSEIVLGSDWPQIHESYSEVLEKLRMSV